MTVGSKFGIYMCTVVSGLERCKVCPLPQGQELVLTTCNPAGLAGAYRPCTHDYYYAEVRTMPAQEADSDGLEDCTREEQ